MEEMEKMMKNQRLFWLFKEYYETHWETLDWIGRHYYCRRFLN